MQHTSVIEQLNQEFDDLRVMGSDYAGMIVFLNRNRDVLESHGWKVNKLISRLNRIIKLVESL